MPVLTAFVLFLTLLATGCQPLRVEAPAVPGGDLLVYLHPLPQGADRLRFSLAEVAAVREDGSVYPLQLHLQDPTARPGGQRLVASGRIPEGAYRGLVLTFASASMATEEGEAALLIPQKTILAEQGFIMDRDDAALLELAYRHEGSVLQQFQFAPLVFAYSPERPVVSRMAFATDAATGIVTVFDRLTLRVTGVVPVGRGAAGLAIDERARRGYVAAAGEDSVLALDLVSGAPLGRIPLQAGDHPVELALTPDGRLLLAASPGADVVSFLDPGSLAEIARLPVGDEPESIIIDRSGRLAYVFNRRSNNISVLDLGRREVLTTLATDPGPIRGALNRDGTRLYVLHRESLYLSVFDVATLAVRERLPVGMGGTAILVDPRTDFLYLSIEGDNRVHVFDPFSLQPVDYLPLPDGGGATEMLIDEEENVLFATLPQGGKVLAIDLVGKRVRGVVETGRGLHSLGMMGARR